MKFRGDRMKDVRVMRGYTQEELAQRIGANLRMITRYEKGVNDPTGDIIASIANALEVSADYLLDLSDQMLPNVHEQDLTPQERRFIEAVRTGRLQDAFKALGALAEKPE